ncbi:hypothetical protein H0A61_01573 [Koleobacter methoxysyntrophicus]|uniref:Na+/glutamate symporter n=1 Tax=Koleobacter methoxysyntrophicus TaxID=2751313 RepID=A0A8A0RN16_9FIRM|nr:hypothetical protein [Koleobacter methoxysyntrophicus]QSQ09214.1 hypothetical protein H0A61_01573 [Koleobacter methoxysyntrophicus]
MSVIVAFVVVAGIMAIGDIVSAKTKAFIPSVFVAAVLFLAGFWTFLPQNLIDIPGLGMPLALMSMYLLLVHMGTLMSVRELVAQWKTIVIALSGIAGMCVLLLTIGRLLVGREAIIAATPPLTGGIIAAIMMSDAATAKGLTSMAVLAIVMYVMQGFAGYPLTALALKKEGTRLLDIYRNDKEELAKLNSQQVSEAEAGRSRFQIFPQMPEKYLTVFVIITKLALVAWASVAFAGLINNAISPFVICLLFGVIAAETGFLERKPLVRSGSFGWLMLSLMAYIFAQLAKATPEMLKEIAGPLVIIIVIGVAGMAVVSTIVGRLLGYSKAMAFALSLTALYGFPPNYILTEEAANALAESPEEKEFLMNQMLPKMLVGGFTTVTVVSVILAGFFAEML